LVVKSIWFAGVGGGVFLWECSRLHVRGMVMGLEEKYLVIEVPVLDDFPSSKHRLFCGIAKLVNLGM